jgi:hypothetical protein
MSFYSDDQPMKSGGLRTRGAERRFGASGPPRACSEPRRRACPWEPESSSYSPAPCGDFQRDVPVAGTVARRFRSSSTCRADWARSAFASPSASIIAGSAGAACGPIAPSDSAAEARSNHRMVLSESMAASSGVAAAAADPLCFRASRAADRVFISVRSMSTKSRTGRSSWGSNCANARAALMRASAGCSSRSRSRSSRSGAADRPPRAFERLNQRRHGMITRCCDGL